MPTTTRPEAPSASSAETSPEPSGTETSSTGATAEVSVKSADFAELEATPPASGAAALDNLLEVSVCVTAELGRATTSIGQLLRLNVGSVVELERLVSDPVDLIAQGVRLARGEVVVVDDRFAIRIQEIVDPKRRS